MKSLYKWIFILLAIVAVIAIAVFFFMQKNNQNTPSNGAERISTETNVENGNLTPEPKEPTEEEIAKFSTPIIDKDDNRDTNLKISAAKLNGKVIKSGEEFSFNKIAGCPTPEEGYKKASIFVDGKMTEGYGGGNCQITSTIYNAVLKVKDLKVTERHEHGKEVGYIEMGKDATVAYDYLDLKFKNNGNYDIKLYVDISKEKVNVKIMKLIFQ